MNTGTFGQMRRTPSPKISGDAPRPIAFHRTKYGRELLVDAAMVSRLENFILTEAPHTLDFHDILLVTRGRGAFVLDGVVHPVAPGTIVFSRPGEVRQWRVRGLDGACVFFTADFLTEAFNDARFVEQFACFARHRPSAALPLNVSQRRHFLARFHEMEREIATVAADASHALRALVYHLLVWLHRCYVRRHGTTDASHAPELVDRFRAAIEKSFERLHHVGQYATAIGVSVRHLNYQCTKSSGRSAGRMIRDRLALEGRRLLAYTDLPVRGIADRLGFADAAYFARFFRREVGVTPSAYRIAQRRPSGRAGGVVRLVRAR